MTRKLLPLAFVLALVGAACSEPPDPEIEFGSGQRFVPFVADSLNDAGRDPAVVVNDRGLPIVSYFGFEEETAEGQLPEARPVGAPTLPGVLAATVNPEGIWTRGALAVEQQIPNVTLPFAPGYEASIADLTAGNVTGLDMVIEDDGTIHAVWGSVGGLFYATGSGDPASTEQITIQKVTSTPPVGPSLAVDGDGTPWVAYYTSNSPAGRVELATPSGSRWSTDAIAETGGCETCRTAVVATGGGAAVAYSEAGNGVAVASNDGENGWVSQSVEGAGGQGLAGAAVGDDLALTYYVGGEVHLATGAPSGPFETASASAVADGSDAADGSGTSVAADDNGTLWMAWFDAAEGVRFASTGEAGPTVIETGADTATGWSPDVAVAPDGSTAYLTWYDSQEQDLLVAAYGEVEGLALAAPSPEAPIDEQPVIPSDAPCEEVVDGSVSIQAVGLAFETNCIDVPAGEAFQIEFGNEEAAQHNVSIYADDSATEALFQGEIISGPDSITYDVPALDAGEYYFQCDVHPNMNGTVNAGGSGSDGGGDGATGTTGGDGATGTTGGDGATGTTGNGGDGGDGEGGTVTVVAVNIAFDTNTIELAADTENTITLDNQDAGVQHNISIYTDDTLEQELFNGELITGPDTIDYAVPPLEAGEYYFLCIVHPNMNGTVTVA